MESGIQTKYSLLRYQTYRSTGNIMCLRLYLRLNKVPAVLLPESSRNVNIFSHSFAPKLIIGLSLTIILNIFPTSKNINIYSIICSNYSYRKHRNRIRTWGSFCGWCICFCNLLFQTKNFQSYVNLIHLSCLVSDLQESPSARFKLGTIFRSLSFLKSPPGLRE